MNASGAGVNPAPLALIPVSRHPLRSVDGRAPWAKQQPEYVYCNSLIAGQPGSYGKYETDYRGFCHAEGLRRLALLARRGGQARKRLPQRDFVSSSRMPCE